MHSYGESTKKTGHHRNGADADLAQRKMGTVCVRVWMRMRGDSV